MSLQFIQKGDNNFLNHPDFQDVARATFKKGIIKDFQKDGDDPLKVKPLVSVDIGGDPIPLFYRPKKQYWDGDDHQATDFGQDDGFYYKAWQSFRCGDEVAVMLNQNIPVAVVGFTDGLGPGIGEDIVKVNDGLIWYQCSKMGWYDQGDTGPDGKDLGLTKQGVQLFNVTNQKTYANWSYVQSSRINYNSDGTPSIGRIPYWVDGVYMGMRDEFSDSFDFWLTTYQYEYTLIDVAIPVGPIMHIFQFVWLKILSETIVNYDFLFADIFTPNGSGAHPPNLGTIFKSWALSGVGGVLPGPLLDGLDPSAAMSGGYLTTTTITPSAPDESWNFVGSKVVAAIYNDQTKDPVVTGFNDPTPSDQANFDELAPNWGNQYDGFTEQTGAKDMFISLAMTPDEDVTLLAKPHREKPVQ